MRHKLSTKIIRENQTVVLEDLFAKHSEGNVSGMVKNRKLSRAISDLGWRTHTNIPRRSATRSC
ncbi:MAG: hypothetical protein F6K39_02590 [Okeania sp. SIO3B3]|nr:hypothetical protein [Okeania sp. SIO3B3]